MTTPDGQAPRAVFWRGRRFGVVAIQDRWRIDDEWWRQEVTRMYFQLLLDGQRVVTIFHDLVGDGWFFQHAGAPKPVDQPVTVIVPRDLGEAPRVIDLGAARAARGG